MRHRRLAIADQVEIRRKIKAGEPVTDTERRREKISILDDGDNRLVNYRWRHTAASTLIMMGVDLLTVAKLLGTSVAMLQKFYGHILDDHLAAAAEKLGATRLGNVK